MTFAEQLQAIIDRTGWTQNRLSAEIGASPAMVSRWINGRFAPSRGNEQRVCELGRSLGVDAGPTTLERLGVPAQTAIRLRTTDLTSLVRFEWSGSLTPSAAAKVASIIADDMADRAFHRQATGSLKTIVKRRLTELEINPFEAARRSGLERSFVNDILNGKKQSIRGDNAGRLATALEIDVASLLSQGDER